MNRLTASGAAFVPCERLFASGNAVASGLTLSALLIAKPVEALWWARPTGHTFRCR